MTTGELLRKLRRGARKRGLYFAVKKHESKGSHRRVYLGDRNTTVPWTKNLTAGVLRAILKQLRIDDDFL